MNVLGFPLACTLLLVNIALIYLIMIQNLLERLKDLDTISSISIFARFHNPDVPHLTTLTD
jgi:hypothetical protein